MHRCRFALALAGVACALGMGSASPAHGFQIQTSVTEGCHETITLDALAQLGWPGDASMPDTGDAEALIEDLPFQIPDDRANLVTASLLIGVRFNDIRGHAPSDLAALANVHNDPADQPGHCLRMVEHDFGDGDARALDACRAFIFEQLERGLGESDELDEGALIEVEVFLAFRGKVMVALPRHAFHFGRALHALQDSFTHAFRDPADHRVRHVLNWIDATLSSDYDEARDGVGHMGRLDDCTIDSPGAARRTRWATEASLALLDAVIDDTGGRAGRLARAAAVLDEYLALAPGCVADNDWCDAGEPFEPTAGCAISAGADVAVLALALLCLVITRRRVMTGLLACAIVAQASGVSVAERADEPVQRPPGVAPLGVYGALGASLDRGALAGTLGLRWNPPGWRIALGLDAEFNPWFSLDAGRFAPGVVNVYGTFIYRHKVFESWELRTTGALGTSVLLFDLVGVNEGSAGAYVGFVPLGVAIPLRGGFRLVVDPLGVALPVPLLQGFPFFYRQYRATFGVEWYWD